MKIDRTAQPLPLRRTPGPDGARGVQEVIEPLDRPTDPLDGDDHEEEAPRSRSDGQPADEDATEEPTVELDLLNPKKRDRPSVSDVYPEPEDEETSRELDLVI